MNGMNEYIEMSVRINGHLYAIREDLPALMKISRGPLSKLSAMASAIDRISGRLALLIDNCESSCDFIPWQPNEAQKHGYLVTPTRKEHHDPD